MDENTYKELLSGGRRGKNYQDEFYYIKQEKKSIKDISRAEISPPTNINPESTIKNESIKRKPPQLKKPSVDPKVLEKLFKRK